MPLLPIDLQTMFSQMNQVGKEQAAREAVSPQFQLSQGAEIVKRTEEDDNSVNQTRDTGDGLEKVKDQKEREGKRRASGREKKEKESTREKEKKYFEDPDLGHHVNIVG